MRGYGGPRDGVGRSARPLKGWVRSEGIRTTYRPQEAEDLRRLAAAWDIPPATVVWCIVHSQLREWGRLAPDYGAAGASLVGALDLLRQLPRDGVES